MRRKLYLLGNYEPDHQQSMTKFAELIRGLFADDYDVRLLKPEARLCKRNSFHGLSKWAAYVDKFLIFPATGLRRLRAEIGDDIIHICDHSNAVYLSRLQGLNTIVTCHDVLAIKGAMGYDTNCPATRTGKILQASILKNLGKAKRIACVSEATRQDLLELRGDVSCRSAVVHSTLNGAFRKMTEAEIWKNLAQWKDELRKRPFLFHVGSNLPRKNRDGLLRCFKLALEKRDLSLVFAGEALNTQLTALKNELGLGSRVIEIARPNHDQLVALYSACEALVFPSTHEGFGWPLLEAQACGAPVICSRETSLPEVAGEGAIYCSNKDAQTYAAAIERIGLLSEREEIVRKGWRNLERFTPEMMKLGYQREYEKISQRN